jgi:hypothetical protein
MQMRLCPWRRLQAGITEEVCVLRPLDVHVLGAYPLWLDELAASSA